MTNGSEYLLINPKGSVPALIVDGRALTENLAIQTYLARRHPDAQLLPLGDVDTEARVLEMLSWFASSIHPLVRQLRFPKWYSDDPEARVPASQGDSALQTAFSILEDRLGGRVALRRMEPRRRASLVAIVSRTGSRLTGRGSPGFRSRDEV